MKQRIVSKAATFSELFETERTPPPANTTGPTRGGGFTFCAWVKFGVAYTNMNTKTSKATNAPNTVFATLAILDAEFK